MKVVYENPANGEEWEVVPMDGTYRLTFEYSSITDFLKHAPGAHSARLRRVGDDSAPSMKNLDGLKVKS